MVAMKRRYERNGIVITPEENRMLATRKVCVAGCGGLGGGVIEGLVRCGVGNITAVDGDVFDETNLNRQILSNESNLGKSKAGEAVRQMKEINSQVEVIAVETFIDESNAEQIITGSDVVVDALDNISARKVLEAACERQDIPMVHGAIAGWNGQVAVVMPGDRLIGELYSGEGDRGVEVRTGNPYFTPAVVSAIQVAETVKLLTGKGDVLRNKLLMIDMLHHQYEIIEFGE